MSEAIDLAPDDLESIDLTCPACNANLLEDASYNEWRVCGTCNRHFWMSGRERLFSFARFGPVTEVSFPAPHLDALQHHRRLTAADRQEDARERTALADAVVTARVSIDGAPVMFAVLDPVLLPTGLGLLTADKLIGALRMAVLERLPMVVVCGGGSVAANDGLLTSAQTLRISGAISELHRAGLPLIAILSHPTGGNVLSGIAVNADIRLAEPGVEAFDAAVPDEEVGRSRLPDRIRSLLGLLDEEFRLAPAAPIALAGSNDQLSVRVVAGDDAPCVRIEIDTGRQAVLEMALIRRGLGLAATLELPIVFSVTGGQPLPLALQSEIRELLVRHRRPVIGVLSGECAAGHLNLMVTDAIVGRESLQITSGKGRRYFAQEAQMVGLVDAVAGVDLDEVIGDRVAISQRISPSRRFERRLRAIDVRGSEVSPDETLVELRNLKELQANFVRSVEELRHKFEHREFTLPTLGQLQSHPLFTNVTLPKIQMKRLDLIELRDRWMARRRGGGPPKAPDF
jgi:acetyl-CoA carboxylase carboxyl transferase subunit beta